MTTEQLVALLRVSAASAQAVADDFRKLAEAFAMSVFDVRTLADKHSDEEMKLTPRELEELEAALEEDRPIPKLTELISRQYLRSNHP